MTAAETGPCLVRKTRRQQPWCTDCSPAATRKGVRIVVAGAEAAYTSLHQILKLSPDIIKLGLKLTRDIDRDPVKGVLATDLAQFARKRHAIENPEGIDTPAVSNR